VEKDAKMPSFEAASQATELSNNLFIGMLLTIIGMLLTIIGMLLTIIVFGALGAYVASRRSR
jgi:putative exporter of polyketide antibiotics